MRKILSIALLVVAPVLWVACDSTNDTTDGIGGDTTPVPETDRKEACEAFRNDLCNAIDSCDKLSLYGYADIAACKADFDANISNCGGCDKTQPDMLTLSQEALLDTCLSDTGAVAGTECNTLFPDATTIGTPASCETYGEAVGAATCI